MIVADVGSYKEFIPWCTNSSVYDVRPSSCKAKLEIGFPPLQEKYTSSIKLVRPNLVHVRDFKRFGNFKKSSQSGLC